MGERRHGLMLKAAAAFEDGRVPDRAFLVENRVTLDECGDLLDDIARAIRIYLRMDKDDRTEQSIRAIGDRDPELAEVVGFVADGMRMTALTRKLRDTRR